LLRACLSSDSFHLRLRFIGNQEPPDRRHALLPKQQKHYVGATSCHAICRLLLNPPTRLQYL